MAKKLEIESKSTSINILRVSKDQVRYALLGTTPIILNRVSEKAKRELLIPSGRKTQAERETTLKHDPMAEFRAAPYIDTSDDGPTHLQHLATAIKAAMRNAALDLPGAKKAQIGRLCWVLGERLPIYGVPQMLMSVVRNAGIVRTPDIRTRVIIPKWAMLVEVEYVTPLLKEQGISNLLASAGITQGTGDWRTEKGSATYGCWELVAGDDERIHNLMKTGGRLAQMKAMENPDFYDQETEDLFRSYQEVLMQRLSKKDREALRMDAPEVPVTDGRRRRAENGVKA